MNLLVIFPEKLQFLPARMFVLHVSDKIQCKLENTDM